MYENWTVEGWNWIDLVAEKAIADLRILGSGHTRMALGNTRMDEEDDVLDVVWSLLVRV
jgi:hypothetical protein